MPKSRVSVLSVILLAGLLPAGSAWAQPVAVKVPRHPFSVSVGEQFFSGDTKEFITSNSFLWNVGYDFLSIKAVTQSVTFQVYVEGMASHSKDRTAPDTVTTPSGTVSVRTGDVTKLRMPIGIGVAVRTPLGQGPLTLVRPYVGVGIGYYHTSVSGSSGFVSSIGDFETFTSDANDADKNGVGGKIFLGVDSRLGIFGEVGYTALPKPKLKIFSTERSFNLSGFNIRVGYRF